MESGYESASDEEIVAWLEEEGALEWVGMDDSGERTLSFNVERLKEVAPEIYEAWMEDVSYAMQNLYEMGLVEVECDENLEPKFRINEEGRKALEDSIGMEIDWNGYEGPNN